MSWQIPPGFLAAIRAAVGPALVDEVRPVYEETQLRVPLDVGDLLGSGKIYGPEWDGDKCTVMIGYGEGPEPLPTYAVVQHERLDYEHLPGRTAKYVENPATRGAPGVERDLVAGLAARMKEGG